MTKVSSLVWPFIALLSLLGLSQAEGVLIHNQNSVEVLEDFKPYEVRAQPFQSLSLVFPSHAHAKKTDFYGLMQNEVASKPEDERNFVDKLYLTLGQSIHTKGYLGQVGSETTQFEKKCRNVCQRNSKRRCRHMRRKSSHTDCPFGAFLGFWRVPSCCFYWHCLSFYRPLGRPRSWWKSTKIRSIIRRSCIN